MREWLMRLRAALTPQALALLGLALLLMLGGNRIRSQDASQTALESRVSRVLSQMEGAGNVDVVIKMKMIAETNAGLSAKTQEIPDGAIAVAQGADDPFVRFELQEALCALLGLAPAAVSVVAGGG